MLKYSCLYKKYYIFFSGYPHNSLPGMPKTNLETTHAQWRTQGKFNANNRTFLHKGTGHQMHL